MKNQRVVPNKLTSEHKGYYMLLRLLTVCALGRNAKRFLLQNKGQYMVITSAHSCQKLLF